MKMGGSVGGPITTSLRVYVLPDFVRFLMNIFNLPLTP